MRDESNGGVFRMELVNHDIEQKILGVFLNSGDGERTLSAFNTLKPDHFAVLQHQIIFEEMQKLGSTNVSAYKLAQRMPDEKEYIQKLIGFNSGVLTIKSNVASLIDLYKRRKLREVSKAMQELIEDSTTTANESIVSLNSKFESLLKSEYEFAIKSSSEVAKEIYENLHTKAEITSTGLAIFDKAMGGGLYRGKAYAVAARKKTGKTILAGTLSHNLNHTGHKHMFIAAEMTPLEIHQRVISRDMNTNPLSFIGENRDKKWFKDKVGEYKDPDNCYYLGDAGISFNRLRMAMSTAVVKYKVEGVILDYFQLVGGAGKDNLVNHLDEVAQWIATFCRDNNIWAVVMAQMNQSDNIRGGEGLRLAFDQVYELKRCGDSVNGFYCEQMDTRYTPWCEMGSEDIPCLEMDKISPYFKDYQSVVSITNSSITLDY